MNPKLLHTIAAAVVAAVAPFEQAELLPAGVGSVVAAVLTYVLGLLGPQLRGPRP
jgi:hypothetical protein